MVLSTTGFGNQAGSAGSRDGQSYQSAKDGAQASFTNDIIMQENFANDATTLQNQGGLKRPRPRFDMNLGDLFTDDITAFRQFNRPSSNVPFASGQQGLAKAGFQSASASVQGPLSSKQEEAFDPGAGITLTTSSPTIAQPSTQQQGLPQLSTQTPYNTFAQNVQSSYPDISTFSDLDWLDSFGVGSSTNPNPNFAAAENGTIGNNTDANLGELDLGFGMGWDGGAGNHDWADGGGFDLFDGFFFGNGGGGGSSGM